RPRRHRREWRSHVRARPLVKKRRVPDPGRPHGPGRYDIPLQFGPHDHQARGGHGPALRQRHVRLHQPGQGTGAGARDRARRNAVRGEVAPLRPRRQSQLRRLLTDTGNVRYLDVDTSTRISKIGLGTWQFGSRTWGYGEPYAEGEARAIVARAL